MKKIIRKLFGISKKEIALSIVMHFQGEWMKAAAAGKGYIPSHRTYVYEEIEHIIRQLEKSL